MLLRALATGKAETWLCDTAVKLDDLFIYGQSRHSPLAVPPLASALSHCQRCAQSGASDATMLLPARSAASTTGLGRWPFFFFFCFGRRFEHPSLLRNADAASCP
jgi:hypothetical protein